MPPKGPVSVLVYHPDEAQAYARLVRAPRGQVRLRVAASPEAALPFVEEMDVLYTWGFPTEFLPKARRLRWVQVMGAGVNAFLDAPFPPKVVLTRVEGVFGPWMAEYAFGWMLWASQRTEPLRALQRLAPGGVLATYTCSHHMQDAELRGVLAEAATDAKRKVRVLEWCHQPSDHPVLVTMQESEYLRGYLVRAE